MQQQFDIFILFFGKSNPSDGSTKTHLTKFVYPPVSKPETTARQEKAMNLLGKMGTKHHVVEYKTIAEALNTCTKQLIEVDDAVE